MTLQYQFDYDSKLPVSAQAGRQQSYENSKEEWRCIFEACILAAARKKFEIVSDDVLAEVEALGHSPTTHNLSAIGGAMHRASKMGILRGTDRVRRSERPEKHGNRQNIWESNYYRSPK